MWLLTMLLRSQPRETLSADNQNPFTAAFAVHRPSRDADVMNPGPFSSFAEVFAYYFIGDFAWSQLEVACFAVVVGFTFLASIKVVVNVLCA